MNAGKSLLAGVAGATFLNIVHESVRRVVPSAPRVDLMGRQIVARSFRKRGKKVPSENKQYALAMAGDLLSNTLFYSLVGWGKGQSAWWKGLLLGLSAGLGAVKAPDYMDLPKKAVKRQQSTKYMTIAWYLMGGLVAGTVAQLISKRS